VEELLENVPGYGTGEDYVHFLKLSAEKQEFILNTAYSEIIDLGYYGARTDTIAEKANISKGILFHYFGSKGGLYKFLLQTAVQRISRDVFSSLDTSNGDIFDIIKRIMHVRIELCEKYPNETAFFISFYTSNRLPEDLAEYRQTFRHMDYNYIEEMSVALDENLLRDDVAKETALEIIIWVYKMYTNRVISEMRTAREKRDWHSLADEFDKYRKILKRGIYN
jgi:AcrR family transcriptional regulator